MAGIAGLMLCMCGPIPGGGCRTLAECGLELVQAGRSFPAKNRGIVRASRGGQVTSERCVEAVQESEAFLKSHRGFKDGAHDKKFYGNPSRQLLDRRDRYLRSFLQDRELKIFFLKGNRQRSGITVWLLRDTQVLEENGGAQGGLASHTCEAACSGAGEKIISFTNKFKKINSYKTLLCL